MARRPLLTVVFALAFIAGAYLRLSHLNVLPMSADEGATWASASASSVTEVIARQQNLNAGKLPVHDLTLHFWIGAFGDGLAAMRLLSAIAGLAAVLLMLPVTREILQLDNSSETRSSGAIDTVAVIAFAICAVSLIAIKYSREMRMYSLMLAAAEAQVWIFVRALRRGTLASHLGVVLFTALVVAINPIAAPLAAAEALWLIFLFASGRAVELKGNALRVFIALATGITVLTPALAISGRRLGSRVSAGGFNWLEKPVLWAPLSLFSKAEGTFVFPLVAIFAAWGIWRSWGRASLGLSFLLAWLLLAPILLMIGSYAFRPMFLERYVVYVFPPLFILTALGISEIAGESRRIAAALLVIVLSLGHVYEYSRKPHGVDWAQAAAAASNVAQDGRIAVAPSYAVSVLRYYIEPDRRDRVTPNGEDTATTLVVAPSLVHNQSVLSDLQRKYPVVIAQGRGIAVRSRGPQAARR